MKLLVVTADYSNWMYKSLYDEQKHYLIILKKNHKIYVFGPGQKNCASLNVDFFLKKLSTKDINGIIFLFLREIYDGINDYEMRYFQ